MVEVANQHAASNCWRRKADDRKERMAERSGCQKRGDGRKQRMAIRSVIATSFCQMNQETLANRICRAKPRKHRAKLRRMRGR
jgi:hypothetical protein